ncbi:MAG: dipeptidase [bacterium]
MFHRNLFIADLHADTLLWNRDLLARGRFGHTDVPRFRVGGVDLQVLAAVTQTPLERRLRHDPEGRSHCSSGDDLNMAALLSIVQMRPLPTWFDRRARALHQAERLHAAAKRSREGGTEIVILKDASDLRRLVTIERAGRDVMGALLALEGTHWIGEASDDPALAQQEVQRLFDAGFRMLALTHRFDNALAGSSEGCTRGGLTETGRVVLGKALDLGMVIDLAHLSPAALEDTLRFMEDRRGVGRRASPPVVSHTGVQKSCSGRCERHRNLSAAEVLRVAALDGVIGIGFWPEAVGSEGKASILRAFAEAAATLRRDGLDPWNHLAFGSDYDGAVEVPFDVGGLPSLTHALLQGGQGAPPVPLDALARIAGANVCRVLATGLPGGSAATASGICDPLRRPPL